MNFPTLLAALKVAEEQFVVNAPLKSEASQSLDIGDTLAAVQPLVAKANAFVVARPGAVTAARTVLALFKGKVWADALDDILAAAPGALATADKDLPFAISLLKGMAPAGGIAGENPNDLNIKDR